MRIIFLLWLLANRLFWSRICKRSKLYKMFSAICTASDILAKGYDSVLKNTSNQLKFKGYSEEKINSIQTALENELEAEFNLRLKKLASLEAKHKARSGEPRN